MAASSNDSFGLKIATAFSIALTVVLLVAVYFLNSNYNVEFEKNVAAQKKIGELNGSIRDVTNQANEYRNMIGYPALEDYEAAKAAIKKDQDQLKLDVQAIQAEVLAAVDEFKKKIEGKPTEAADLEALKQRAGEIVAQFSNNPDQSYKALITRLKDLTLNQAKLSTNLALNYIDLRSDLDQANTVNAKAKKVVEDARDAAKADLVATIAKDEEERAALVKTRAEQADAIASAEVAMTNARNELEGKIQQRDKTIGQLNSSIRDFRTRMSLREDVMTKPGGRVTFVDYGTKQVRVNINKSQGVRPLMRFTIFDQDAAGVASARPKGAIELTSVGDPRKGENDSIGRIVTTFDNNDPIRRYDFIYSVGWSYDHPQRFALVGKLDINRDGRDDRADLIRMIESSGGVVEYDLPPPGVDRGPGQAAIARAFTRLGEPQPPSIGRAAGKISALAFAYIVDTRTSLNPNAAGPSANDAKEDSAFQEEMSVATKEARDSNVRPLPIEKLLNMLGYDYSAPIEGRREAYDRAGVRDLLKPKVAGQQTPPAQPSNTTPPAGDSMPK